MMNEFIEICPSCLEPCRIVTQDHGIGHYEYWGAKGVDRQIMTLTECCDVTPLTPYIKSSEVEPCHLNGGETKCSVCPFNDYCTDALPVEDDA